MAGGLRYKFHGSEIKLLTGYGANSPSIGILGITQADPAVVHYNGADIVVEGDVVKFDNQVGGMTELRNTVQIAANVDTAANTFELFEVDSTAYGAFTSGGHFDIGEFSDLCELTNYNRQGGTSPEIPATTICSTAQEFEVGLPDFGTTQIDYNFAPQVAVQAALHQFYLSGDIMGVRVILPRNGGNLVQLGFVQQESETAGVGGLYTGSLTIRNTGNRFDYV